MAVQMREMEKLGLQIVTNIPAALHGYGVFKIENQGLTSDKITFSYINF